MERGPEEAVDGRITEADEEEEDEQVTVSMVEEDGKGKACDWTVWDGELGEELAEAGVELRGEKLLNACGVVAQKSSQPMESQEVDLATFSGIGDQGRDAKPGEFGREATDLRNDSRLRIETETLMLPALWNFMEFERRFDRICLSLLGSPMMSIGCWVWIAVVAMSGLEESLREAARVLYWLSALNGPHDAEEREHEEEDDEQEEEEDAVERKVLSYSIFQRGNNFEPFRCSCKLKHSQNIDEKMGKVNGNRLDLNFANWKQREEEKQQRTKYQADRERKAKSQRWTQNKEKRREGMGSTI